jgi:hypothetical protein
MRSSTDEVFERPRQHCVNRTVDVATRSDRAGMAYARSHGPHKISETERSEHQQLWAVSLPYTRLIPS